MKLFSKITSLLTAIIMFIGSIFSVGLPVAKNPQNPVVHDDTIMLVSDFQSSISDLNGPDRVENFSAILAASSEKTPGLVVGGGDYQSTFAGPCGSAFGIYQMRKAIDSTWNYGLQYLLAQGNHDETKSLCINKTGLYEFDKYIVYIINEDDFPWNEQYVIGKKENTVKLTAEKLGTALTQLVADGEERPVLVVSHLPLHYSVRSEGKDNRYAPYIFDAISASADKLNIVYLYGHNHSKTYDDYIGGAVNYLAKGDTIQIGGSNEAKTLGFTYTNCGYIGYSNNSASDNSSPTLTVTFITVSVNGLRVEKYSKDGLLMQRDVPSLKTSEPAA